MAGQDAALDLVTARQETDARTLRAEQDLAEQRHGLEEAETLRTVMQELHARNHIAEYFDWLIANGAQNGAPKNPLLRH